MVMGSINTIVDISILTMVMGRYIYAYIVYGYIDILFLWFFPPTFT